MSVTVPLLPKRWNPTQNWLAAIQHPPKVGWYQARQEGESFEAFFTGYVWYRADYGPQHQRQLGSLLGLTDLTFLDTD